MKYKSFVCTACKGIMLGDIARTIIPEVDISRGVIIENIYHVRCGSRLLEEKLIKDLEQLSNK
jgi:hypothetical protein